MTLRKRPIVAGISALLLSGSVSALGLGDIRLHSALNEPLEVEIPLLSLGDLSEAEILAGLASVNDFAKAGLDRELILSSLVFSLDLANSAGAMLRVTSNKPIREPYLNFLVDVQWPAGRLLREYTVLLDLPLYASGGPARNSVEGARTSQARAQPSPQLTVGQDEYAVGGGDTLWSIASSVPSSLPVRQRMTDIQQLNPDAFIDGDMNLVRAGAVLRLPDYGGGSAGQEVQRVQSQSGAYYSGQPMAKDAPTAAQPDASNVGGRLSLSAQSNMASAGGDEGNGTSATRLRGEIDSIQEELARSRRENADLKQRVASLENQISTMQQLLELEDGALHSAQSAEIFEQPAPGLQGEDELVAGVEESQISSPSLALFPSANTAAMRDMNDGAQSVTDGGQADGNTAAAQQQTILADDLAAKAAPLADVDTTTDEKRGESVGGYLTFLLGLLIALVGAIVFIVLRKKRAPKTDDTRIAPRYMPPVALASEPEPAETKPQATSFEDIDLQEGDDLFGAEIEETGHSASRDTPYSADEVDLDLSEFDLHDIAAHSPEPDARESRQESAADLNLDEEFDFLGDIDEGDTQLELAQAYLEIGDSAGAREILGEVAQNGSDEQKAKARQLLGQTD